ncbi:TPA: O156 family O-antigen flippase, partial [Escherichia coli]|nr:O156 family O-antigen flippase [Escherichia coli]
DIIWEGPWVSLVLVTALTIIITPIQITIESLQHQISVFKAQTYASIINSISLCLLLFSGFGLYAIALSLFISNLIVLIFLWGKIKWLRNNLMPVLVDTNFFVVFKEIWPLFSRVAVVSVFGFLFWNGFNLIAFKVYEPSYAGQVILSITLARAGYGFSESILYGQITYIS